jgi:gamma-glutamylcyclotransferase (GGCT)/AIG2-like uncharacterized protein YtfP
MKQLPFFVYGTLLPGQPNYPLWSAAIARARPAVFPNGQLYDLGGYPMLIEAGAGQVQGLVVDIHRDHYPAILQRLDILEGIRPGRTPVDAPYRRAGRIVRVDEGKNVESWVYLGHAGYVSGRALITGGNWQQHTQSRREQIEFFWQNQPDL